MNWKLKVAFFCHLLAALLLVTFGVTYLLRSEFMPYHAVAVGKGWTEVEPAFQILILNLMKVTGGGFLASALAMIILLLKALREGQRWSFWAIPIIGLMASLSSLYATINVGLNTPASPPWMAAALGTVLLIVGFIFSVLPDAKALPEEKMVMPDVHSKPKTI